MIYKKFFLLDTPPNWSVCVVPGIRAVPVNNIPYIAHMQETIAPKDYSLCRNSMLLKGLSSSDMHSVWQLLELESKYQNA